MSSWLPCWSACQAAVDTVLEAEIGDADEEAMEDGRSQASRSQVRTPRCCGGRGAELGLE